jgi:hypothetical protein
VAFPLLAQKASNHENNGNHGDGNHGHHNPHGNGSDHGGHDEDGGGKGHKDKDDKDNGKGGSAVKLVLATPKVKGSVAHATVLVTSDLSSGSLKTSTGALIPVAAQARTYSVLVADRTQSASSAEISAALSTAGPAANAIVPSLMRSFASLGSNPDQLPSAITEYNRFTKVASSGFIANPPPEFLAIHEVLARLTAAASSAK